MTHAEMVAVIQAAERGELIVKKLRYVADADWIHCDGTQFNFESCDYRIAPKPPVKKRVPLGPEEVPPGSAISPDGGKSWVLVSVADRLGFLTTTDVRYEYSAFLTNSHDHLTISRDGGRTWHPCWKEVDCE